MELLSSLSSPLDGSGAAAGRGRRHVDPGWMARAPRGGKRARTDGCGDHATVRGLCATPDLCRCLGRPRGGLIQRVPVEAEDPEVGQERQLPGQRPQLVVVEPELLERLELLDLRREGGQVALDQQQAPVGQRNGAGGRGRPGQASGAGMGRGSLEALPGCQRGGQGLDGVPGGHQVLELVVPKELLGDLPQPPALQVHRRRAKEVIQLQGGA